MDSEKDIIITNKNPLNKDYLSVHKTYVLKRGQKISAALHLLTEHLFEKEPLRLFLREKALIFLSTISFLNKEASMVSIERAREALEEIASALEVGSLSGAVSDTNRAILDREIQSLLGFFLERFAVLKEGPTFASDFFISPFDESSLGDKEKEMGAVIFQNSPSQSGGDFSAHAQMSKEGKTRVSFIEKKEKSYINKYDSEIKRQNKVLRREKIIDLVRNKGQISIKDISSFFSQYSEKTVQRELLSLVSKGDLKKEGERRWSRYSINTA